MAVIDADPDAPCFLARLDHDADRQDERAVTFGEIDLEFADNSGGPFRRGDQPTLAISRAQPGLTLFAICLEGGPPFDSTGSRVVDPDAVRECVEQLLGVPGKQSRSSGFEKTDRHDALQLR